MDKVNHNQFVTDMLRFAAAEASPDDIINRIMKYICDNFHSDRAYIFENNHDGTFNNTYEYCREGVSAEIENLQNVPYDGLLDMWFKEYEKSRNIIIRDLEEYRSVLEAVYQILKPQNINTLVTGPIELDGKYIGFYGVDNPPSEILEDVSQLINMMAFIISMMIKMRNYSRKIEENATHDPLTGCKNRAAFSWAYEGKFDTNCPIAVIMSDLNGLKRVNDVNGHSAGDKFICDAVEVLSVSFGKENVYRIGGDEFVTVLFDISKAEIEQMIESARLFSKLKRVSMSIGMAYRKNGKEPFENIMREADKKMYEQKKRYYEGY